MTIEQYARTGRIRTFSDDNKAEWMTLEEFKLKCKETLKPEIIKELERHKLL